MSEPKEEIDLGLTLEQEQFAQESNRDWKTLLSRADAAAESSDDDGEDDE